MKTRLPKLCRNKLRDAAFVYCGRRKIYLENGARRKRSRRIVGILRNWRRIAFPSPKAPKRRKPSLPSPS